MGEIADAMLDGTLCECCGAYIHAGEADGFPRYCSDRCAGDRGALPAQNRGRKREPEGQSALPRFNPYSIPPRTGAIACPHCPRNVMPQGLQDHIRAKHPDQAKETSNG